jgi:lipopolysaccharide export system permease protein
MILQRYIARRFVLSFLGVLGVFLLMLALFDLVEQIRRFGSTDATFGAIVRLTLLRVPESLYQILPLIVILATLALFLALARSSELVVTRAAGRSAIRSVVAPCIVAGLIGVLGIALVNPLVAATSKRYETVAGRYLGGDPSTLSISREGLWLRQGGDAGQTVIRASRANLDGTQLFDVTFLGFSTAATAQYRIEAAQAELVPGAWAITDAKEWRFDVEGNIERAAIEMAETSLPSNLTRSQILDSFGTPSAIAIWDLPEFIAQLEKAGFSARAHRMYLHMELAMPFLLIAMVLVGAGFTMRHTRSGRTGVMVLMALGLGFALFFIRNFEQVLGENGQIPILLAAWGPPVAAMLLPLGLLLHLEDG